MKKIISGFYHFKNYSFTKRKTLFSKLAVGQGPEVLFLTCSDSRVDPSLITHTEPGELFVIRNAGNIVPPYPTGISGVVASIEYAVAVLKVKHIIICGHSDCGAMKGALDISSVNKMPNVKKWLGYVQPVINNLEKKFKNKDSFNLMEITRQNVLTQINNILTYPELKKNIESNSVDLHGWVYDIKQGSIEVYDSEVKSFISFEEFYESPENE